MRDNSIYTKEGLVNTIRHMRMMRDYLSYEYAREEERLLILLEAAKEFDAPVDSHARRMAPDRTMKQYKFDKIPLHMHQAIRSGQMVAEGIE